MRAALSRAVRQSRPRRRGRGTARRATTRRSPARAARSSRRSSPPGRRRSARRSTTRSSTAPSARAPASRRSRTAGRLRRLRRAADARPADRVQRTASRSRGRSRRRRSPTTCPARPAHLNLDGDDDREDLPRRDHELERPGDQGAEQGREPARPEDHAGLPLGRLGHDLQLHRLPRRRSARPGSRRSAPRQSVSLPAGHRRQRARPASPASSPAPPARSATSTSPSRSRTTSSSPPIQNAAGKFIYPSIAATSRPRQRGHEGAGEQRAAHRQPAEVARRSRTRSRPTPTSSSRRRRRRPSCGRWSSGR